MPVKELFVPSDSFRLHLSDWGGEGPPLLLLHGLAGNTHWWDACAPLWRSHFHVVGLDFRGHGDSDWDPKARYGTEDFLKDVEAARQALGWDRMFLTGHSMGARVACEYAANHAAALTGLIAIDFMPDHGPQRSQKFMRAVGRRPPVYRDKETILRHFRLEPSGTLLSDAALRALGELCICPTEKGWRWKFDWKTFQFHYPSVWTISSHIHVPTLILRGEYSPIMKRDAFERIVAEITGARGIEIPRALHHVPLDAPEQVTLELIRFAQDIAVLKK